MPVAWDIGSTLGAQVLRFDRRAAVRAGMAGAMLWKVGRSEVEKGRVLSQATTGTSSTPFPPELVVW